VRAAKLEGLVDHMDTVKNTIKVARGAAHPLRALQRSVRRERMVVPPACSPCAEEHAERVLKALKRYAYHSQSYSILRSDKSYFFSPSGVDGVIAYVVHANVALAAGDPVCDPADLRGFIAEFRNFCIEQQWRCCFQSATQGCRKVLEELDFGTIKMGEEPIFELDKLSLAGGAFRGLRHDIRSAIKRGLTVVEYRPLSGRRPDWEKQMEELSALWVKSKGSSEFAFLIGEPGLADPGERKYFLALKDDQVEAFVVCTPIYTRNGIYFDLMRRKEKTVSGTSQLLISESFRLLKEQGYAMATLGTAPLANQHVDDPAQSRIIELALKLAFDHLGHFYRFKPLYQFKRQFGPTCWEGRYLAFSPQRFNPVMLYALLKAYDPSGVTGKLSSQIQHAWQGIKKLDQVPENLLDRLKGK
jgi:phosphatidylglycerol lysyltransferase